MTDELRDHYGAHDEGDEVEGHGHHGGPERDHFGANDEQRDHYGANDEDDEVEGHARWG